MKSNVPGISYSRTRKAWLVRLPMYAGVRKFVGRFQTLNEAKRALEQAQR